MYNIEQVFKSVEYNLSFLKDWSNKDLSIGEEGGVYIYSLKVIMQTCSLKSFQRNCLNCEIYGTTYLDALRTLIGMHLHFEI